MATDRARLLELALRGLMSEREQITREIEMVQNELRPRRAKRAGQPAAPQRRKFKFSAGERRRRAERMRQYRAARRAAARSATPAPKAPAKPAASPAERQEGEPPLRS